MLNVIMDYLEADTDEAKAREFVRCVALGKQFAVNIEHWIKTANREASFLGTPSVTRGQHSKQSRLGGASAGSQQMGRIANALERIVGLLEYGLESYAAPAGPPSPSPFAQPQNAPAQPQHAPAQPQNAPAQQDVAESPVTVYDSEDSQVAHHVLPSRVPEFRAQMLDRRAIRAAEEMEGYVNYDMYAEQEEQESEEYHE
jgi:hypothetical protein